MKLAQCLLLSLWTATSVCLGSQWFVAPGNAPGGNGSKLQPWQLQVAFKNTSLVKAGDTVWLRAGTYSNLYTITLSGTSNAPITFRHYNRERAIIDGSLELGDSSNIWLWGLEVIDSNKTNRSNPYGTVGGGSSGTKIINCLIHDCCIGIGSTGARPGPYEAYGNILWYCGKSGLEHGMYWQNEGPNVKLIKHNLIGYSSGFGIQFYGSQGKANNAQIIENAVWGSGALWDGKGDIIMGSSEYPSHDQLISGNSLYNPGGRGLDLGYAQNDTNVVVIGNTIKSASGQWLRTESINYTFTNNLIGSFYGPIFLRSYFNVFVLGPHVWDYNTYYQMGDGGWAGGFSQTNGGSANIPFTQWQLENGFDAHSTYSASPPATNRVYVWPNAYESKRAQVVVWNFGRSNNVPVDLSAVLSAGDTYEIRNAMDYFQGPVVSGTYTGGQITVPLTNLTTATPLNTYPIAYPDNINYTTNFAAFVVIGQHVLAPPEDVRVLSSGH